MAPRLLIASLILPIKPVFPDSDSAVAVDSIPKAVPLSPLPQKSPILSITPNSPRPGAQQLATTAGKRLHSRLDAPLRSIVDDLTVKASGTGNTPAQEIANPFSAGSFPSLASALSGLGARASPLAGRTTLTAAPKIIKRRSTSRSSTGRRRRSSTGLTSSRPEFSSLSTKLTLEPSAHSNGGLHNAVNAVFHDGTRNKTQSSLSITEKFAEIKWIGILDMPTDDFGEPLKRDVERLLDNESQSVPVWCPDEEFAGCYNTFCHQVLWPTLHYAVPDAPKTKVFYESSSFAQYLAVNQRFADAIVEIYKPGDIIWVHDYHLLLLPQLLRKALGPKATIGFFLHVAFPSSEIFRCLAVREELLKGMLGADLIGFQTHNYARHFRQTCFRILSLESLPRGIQLEHSFVDVGVFPMGIDVAALQNKRKEPEVDEWVQLMRQRYPGMKIIVGRDKLDEVQGVKHKLLAFERFLENNPEFQGKAVLIQVALTTTFASEALTQSSISTVLSRITSRFSTLTYQPVVFLHTADLTFNQYLGLLTVADAFLVTSLREGMALRAHEFVECQEGSYGVLVLSEFTGSYSYEGFRSCLPVNPWDSNTTSDAIEQALTMSPEEAKSRWKDLHKHVITQTAQIFVTSFLSRCVRVNLEHQHRESRSIPLLSSADTESKSGGLSTLLPRYHFAKNRLFLIDLEGSLWSEDPKLVKEQGFVLPERTRDVLRALVRGNGEGKNVVWVLSGLPVKGVLEKVVADIPELGVVAENGCFVRPPPSLTARGPEGPAGGEWLSMVSNFNMNWKKLCVEMLGYFTERTPGSFIDERAASVAWRFVTGKVDDAQRQWARRQAAEAQNHIWDSLGERFGLRIIPSQSSFLVLPKTVSRISAVLSSLHQRSSELALSPSAIISSPLSPVPATAVEEQQGSSEFGKYEFVLVISGDDRLIQRMNELGTKDQSARTSGGREDGDKPQNDRLEMTFGNMETCVTKGKSSDAKWRLDSKDVVDVLSAFTK